eukprot:6021920-Prymnesium_polylepis.1
MGYLIPPHERMASEWLGSVATFSFCLSFQAVKNTLQHAALPLPLNSLLQTRDTAGLAGLLGGLTQGLTLPVQPLIGRRIDDWHRQRSETFLVLALVFADSISVCLMGLGISLMHSAGIFAVAFVVQGVASAGVVTLLSALASKELATATHGKAAASRSILQTCGSLLGSCLLASLRASTYFLVCAALSLIAPLISVAAVWRLRHRELDASQQQRLANDTRTVPLRTVLRDRAVKFLLISRALYEMALSVAMLYTYLLADMWRVDAHH